MECCGGGALAVINTLSGRQTGGLESFLSLESRYSPCGNQDRIVQHGANVTPVLPAHRIYVARQPDSQLEPATYLEEKTTYQLQDPGARNAGQQKVSHNSLHIES